MNDYRISSLRSEPEAQVMVAADSWQAISTRIERMVTAGREMVLALREFTYLGRPPTVMPGLRLTGFALSGVARQVDANHVGLTVGLSNGRGGYRDSTWFGFSEVIYPYSGNEAEDIAWRNYSSSSDGGADRLGRRRRMTHVQFDGGLDGWKWKNDDRIVITTWNDDGVATERTLGFHPGDGSW